MVFGMLKASVIVPVHNGEKTIADCLHSILSQCTAFPFEVIVVNDGSTDKTAEIAKEFGKTRLISQKQQGPAVARNNGAKEADGNVIVFIDSDCVAAANWLQEMVSPLHSMEIAGVQGRYKSKQKQLIARLIQLEIEQRHDKMAEQQFIDFMGSYSAAYRKSVFQEMHGFDASFPMASGEDTDLSFRINKKGHKLLFNPKAIVFHTHPTSLHRYLKVKFYRAFWRVKVYGKHKGKIAKDSYTSQAIKAQILIVLFLFLSIIAAIFSPIALYAAGLALLLLFLSGLPFAAWAFKKDKAVGLIAPFVSVIRAIVLATGLALGILNELK